MPKIRRIFLSLLIKPVSASTIPSASPISFVAFDKSNSRIPGSSATSLLHSKPFQTITITAPQPVLRPGTIPPPEPLSSGYHTSCPIADSRSVSHFPTTPSSPFSRFIFFRIYCILCTRPHLSWQCNIWFS